MPSSEYSHRVLGASGSTLLLSQPRRGNLLAGDRSDLLAECGPPNPHLANFARRLTDGGGIE